MVLVLCCLTLPMELRWVRIVFPLVRVSLGGLYGYMFVCVSVSCVRVCCVLACVRTYVCLFALDDTHRTPRTQARHRAAEAVAIRPAGVVALRPAGVVALRFPRTLTVGWAPCSSRVRIASASSRVSLVRGL